MLRLSLCCLIPTVLVVIVIPLSSGFELPFLGSCTLKDEECHKKCVDQFFEMYANGIPELDVPTMDPLYLGNITTKGSLTLNMIDVKLHKFPINKCLSVSVKDFTKDGSNPFKMTVKFKTPEVILRTHCKLIGKLLIFSVDGEADLEVYLSDLDVTMSAVFEPYTKDNKIYFRIKSYTPQLKIGNMKVAFKNSTFFGGDQVFAEAFSDTINSNWMVMAEEMNPELKRATKKITLDIYNKVLATIPHDRFFKEE